MVLDTPYYNNGIPNMNLDIPRTYLISFNLLKIPMTSLYVTDTLHCTDGIPNINFELTLILQNRNIQFWIGIFTNYSSLKYSEFILVFQLHFGTYEAESEHFGWEKEKCHFNKWFFQIGIPFYIFVILL